MKWYARIFILAISIQLAAPAANAKTSRIEKKPISLDDIQLDDETDKGVDKDAPTTTAPAVPSVSTAAEEKNPSAVIAKLKPIVEKLAREDLLRLARAYRAKNDFLNEAHTLEIATGKNAKDYVTLVLLGDAYLKLKRYDDAEKSYLAARTLNPRYRPAYEGQWQVFEKDDSKYEVRTLVLDMIKVFGLDAKTSAALCRMYSGEDFLEKTTEACRSAIDLDRKNPDNYVHLAMSLRDQDQKAEAVKIIDDAAKRFPSSENVQVLAGEMKANEKDFADAYSYYKRAAAANPKSVKAQVGLGSSAFELQKHDEAIAAFKAACRLDRKSGFELRSAALKAKTNHDPKWMAYQDALEFCE